MQPSWVLCCRVSDKVAVQSGWPGLGPHLGLPWGGIHFEAHMAGRVQSHARCWTEGRGETGGGPGETGVSDIPGAKEDWPHQRLHRLENGRSTSLRLQRQPGMKWETKPCCRGAEEYVRVMTIKYR